MPSLLPTITTPVGQYRWIENWITIPDSPLGRENGRTHGVAVLKSGEVVIFHQANPAVLFYSPEGKLLRSWGNYPGAHGLSVVQEDGCELFWLVDEVTKEVVKTTVEGEVLLRLSRPDHPVYQTSAYIPTWAAVAEARFGGNCDIWVADGYGSSLIHRYDAGGKYLCSLDGRESGLAFQCPHGLSLDTRGSEPCFIVADRGNRQLRTFGWDARPIATFGADFFHSPDIAVGLGDHLLVPELVAGLSLLDASNARVATIGFQADADCFDGWPNERKWVKAGVFNSPHSAAVDPAGNIYVVEWIKGGRVTKLERL